MFLGDSPQPNPSLLECLTVSKSVDRCRGWPTKRQKRPKEALANPIRHPVAKERPWMNRKASEMVPERLQKIPGTFQGGLWRSYWRSWWIQKTQRRPPGGQEAPKKARWRPRFLQEAVLVSFWGPFWGPVLHMFGSKIGSNFGSVFGFVFGSVLVPTSGPSRPKEPSTWH